ncbi:probable peptidyl-tRNA hydrolase [Asterias rubens]|uniref:probable peptidyl-tRNA hydrolase n=1 Tax=Asterias rubens TaxID=7604 RepID=UPI0014559053|nr:probable peptidyl-tRNA hydrolase [Asterias rubens]
MIASRSCTVANSSFKKLRLLSRKGFGQRGATKMAAIQMEFSSQIMVVGLGNHSMPNTRHSVGMAAVDRLCRHLKASWSKDGDCQGDVAIATLDSCQRFILLKPRLLMNINGRSVIKAARKYKVASSDIYLVHDDLDRAFGKLSIKEGGSAGGHNGVKSSITALGTEIMPRLRIGIGRPTNQNAVIDYVLGGFSLSEKERLPHILEESTMKILNHVKKRTDKT